MTPRLGILVAGGAGRRMGEGAPKAMRVVGGATLFARAEATLRACCDDWIVCAPESVTLPVASERRVADAAPASGAGDDAGRGSSALAGLVAGLSSRPFGVALVLGVDFPLLDPPTLLALHGALGAHAVALAAPGGVPQPLAAWYAPSAVAPLTEAFARGERTLTRAVLALPHAIVPVDDTRFLNVNTPDDLVRAEALLERHPT
ncbi:MAG: molybdenum cofactor guanylyltransferase [Candidatus Eisenbacteria bacterium]|nr:molybdenum cofactor guanylyltransferase [Candidatus Eisenbacteria bacterium]